MKKGNGGNDCLNEFYRKHIQLARAFIKSPSSLNIAHVLPKSKFRSIQCYDKNVVYLSWQRHAEFDRHVFNQEWDILEKKFSFFTKRLIRHLLDKATEKNKMRFSLEEWLEH